MNFPIFLEYPGWLIIPVIITAAGIAALLYWKNKVLPYPIWVKRLLFALRFLVVLVLGLLLLKPYLLQRIKQVEPPVIVFAHDNSISLKSTNDSAFYLGEYRQKLDSVYKEISADFEIDTLLFGKEIHVGSFPDYTENQTDLAAVFNHLKKRYFRRNLGAVVLFSDGIYNAGYQPELAASNFPFKMHTVGLGDTLIHPDLAVYDLRFNKQVLKKSLFPVEVTVRAQNALRQDIDVSLWMDGKKIGQQKLKAGSNRFSGTLSFQVEADEPGFKNMEVRIAPLDGEIYTTNNEKQFFVEVIEQKQSILVIAKAPHPDLGAIQAALGDQYQIDFKYNTSNLNGDIPKYDLLILHQMPDGEASFRPLQSLLQNRKQLPVLWIIGQQTSLRFYNELQQFSKIYATSDEIIQANAWFNPNFSAFTTDPQTTAHVSQWPPLNLLFADIELASLTETLLYQKIRGIETDRPMLLFTRDQDRKSGLILGTGIWRWRLHDFKNNGSHLNFDALIQQIIRYVSLQNDNSLLKVFAENEYSSGSPVIIKAELRNKSGELVTDVPLKARLFHEQEERSYQFDLVQNPPFYTLNAGHLNEGVYSYMISGELGQEILEASGRFIVEGTSIESSVLVADWKLMQQLANQTGGNFYSSANLNELITDISADETMVSVSRFENLFDALIDLELLFNAIIFLLAVEWFLRKYFGAY
ncbi:MAG: hypothetical protein PWQ54_365 [Bacteroidales bacterium]|nr:hypothetical protein [Bacteroidales bacterium]